VGEFEVATGGFKADLEDVYRRGYRPITIAQMLDKDFRDVPAGMSPVVFVFDDASDSQFRYLEQNGKLDIDPTSAVGIWEDFARDVEGHKGSRFEDAYRRSLQAMKLTQALMGQPRKVAGVIGRALGSPFPRARYLVGYDAQALALAQSLTPTAVKDRVIRLTPGL